MIKININKATTFLPLKKIDKAERTAAGRLKLAQRMNDQFCDSVLSNMDDGKITLPAIVRLLKKSMGEKLTSKAPDYMQDKELLPTKQMPQTKCQGTFWEFLLLTVKNSSICQP